MGTPMNTAPRDQRRERSWSTLSVWGIGAATVIVLFAGVGVTIYAAHQLRSSTARSEDQRLHERAQQTTALVSSVAKTIKTTLRTASAAADATEGNASAFRRSVRQPLADTPVLTNARLG